MNLRIYGNRQLKTLPGKETRPTAARVREALFNIWQGRIEGCHWLDLCSGNGSMGAEALCRGASQVVAIERSGKACSIIRQNWQQVSQSEQEWQIIRGDVVVKIAELAGQQFDFIYFDPPYASNLYQPVLEAIAAHNLLDAQGEIAVEHNPRLWKATATSKLDIYRQKVYGNTKLTFLAHTDNREYLTCNT